MARRFDTEAVERFLAAASGQERAVIEVALGTGMRRCELKAFHTSWIVWEQGSIRIPADDSFVPKDREPRDIPLYPRLEKVLREWLGDRRQGLVFVPLRWGNSGTGKVKGTDLRRIFRKVRVASGVPFTGWHDLRHHYISLLFKLNRPIPEIMEISGHSDMATVAGYAHANPNYLKEARAALETNGSVSESVTPPEKGPSDEGEPKG